MRLINVAVIALLPSLALAQPLPQPKPLGPGGSCPHGASEWQLSARLDPQRLVLSAQRQWALAVKVAAEAFTMMSFPASRPFVA
jgi:hypothetical protein